MELILATRKSALAQTQTQRVMKLLKEKSGVDSKKFLVVTEGDKRLDVSLNKIGGKGLFTKEIEIALLENIQREDLNPMDEAVSISNIIKLRGYTQDEFANKFGKSRTYVTNILGLLKLPEDVKKMVEKRTLSMSHARVLSKIDDEEKVVRLAKQVITDELSVRELEKITQDDKKEIEVVKNKSGGYDHKYRMYENIIMDNLDTKVRVSKKKIEIYFDGVNELEEILSKMNVKVEEE